MGAEHLTAAILAFCSSAALTACGGSSPADDIAPGPDRHDTEAAVVSRVTDGDTLRLRDGRRVRLLQIDAPEIDECFATAATRALTRRLPVGRRILLVRDRALDGRDGYGRLLRYVVLGDENVNVDLVRTGAAVPYFFHGGRGRFAAVLLGAARQARRERRGLWGACPGARLDPNRGSSTGPA